MSTRIMWYQGVRMFVFRDILRTYYYLNIPEELIGAVWPSEPVHLKSFIKYFRTNLGNQEMQLFNVKFNS